MKYVFMIFGLLSFYQLSGQGAYHQEACVSDEEYRLFQLINAYRIDQGLPKISLSASLCYVAGAHAWDLNENQPDQGDCNMHSWSENGPWTACCYTNDHKYPECIWSKPSELTDYKGFGYEIAYYSSWSVDRHVDLANAALEGWKDSPGHNRIIVNKYAWKRMTWKAMGVGIYGHYVVVWFGEKKDPSGSPRKCK